MSKNHKLINLPTLNNSQLLEIDNLKKLNNIFIDTKDIPQLTIEEYEIGYFHYLK